MIGPPLRTAHGIRASVASRRRTVVPVSGPDPQRPDLYVVVGVYFVQSFLSFNESNYERTHMKQIELTKVM